MRILYVLFQINREAYERDGKAMLLKHAPLIVALTEKVIGGIPVTLLEEKA